MVSSVINPTQLESLINQAFQIYRSSVLSLTKKQWKEEDLKGKSLVQYSVAQYYYSIYIAVMMYNEIQRGFPHDPSYYIDKYSIENIRKCLACEGIDIDKILEVFDLPPEESSRGIELMEIENNMIVGPYSANNLIPTAPSVPIDLRALISLPNSCYNLISQTCPYVLPDITPNIII